MSLKRKLDTLEDKEFWNSIDAASWEIQHTWPDWKAGETGRALNRREVKTLADVRELARQENYQMPQLTRGCYHLKFKHGEFLAMREGDKVRIFKPAALFVNND